MAGWSKVRLWDVQFSGFGFTVQGFEFHSGWAVAVGVLGS